jgi:thiamine biosynthesis lipoprotein ApbE
MEGGECKIMRVGVEGIWYSGEGEGVGIGQKYEGGRWRVVILSPEAEDKLLG